MGLFGRTVSAGDDSLTRLQMEYQNYRRRTALELEQAENRGAEKTARAFLGLYDDLSRALGNTCTDPAFYRGVEMILANFMAACKEIGMEPMDSKGKIFNPTYHEAVEQIIDPAYRQNEIAEVRQVGFLLDGEVIRHAKVVVANCE